MTTISRSSLRSSRRKGIDSVEAASALKKIRDRAARAGHVLAPVLERSGPRGGRIFVQACSCGSVIENRSAWAVYREGYGHLGDALGDEARKKVARHLPNV